MKQSKMKVMFRVLALVLCVSMFFPLSVFATESQTPSGIDYDEIEKKVEEYIEQRKETTASVSLAVFNEQETIYQTHYGYANIDKKIKADEATVYEWASVTKLLVWTSVMQLYEQGKLDLNTDIREYLPKGFLTRLSYDTPITMTHLMNHTAGFQELVYSIVTTSSDEIINLEKALIQNEPPQIYEPGTMCSYSNWGASLAGYIVERISGQSFSEYVHNNIFKPLGMDRTAILSDWSDNEWVQKQRQLLNCYAIYSESNEDFGKGIEYIQLYPCGSATGTLDDFMKFAKAFTPAKGAKSPLFAKQETLDTMLSTTSYYGDSQIPRNSHGMWVLQYANNVVGHNGNSYCSSTLMIDPTTKLGIVIMTNEVGETTYNYGLLSLIFGEYKPTQDASNKTDTIDLSGIYTSSRANMKNGFAKVNKYIGSLMPLSSTGEPGVYKMPIGDAVLKKVADNQYIMDNGNGMKYLMCLRQKDDGTLKFEMMSQDIVKENTLLFYCKIGLLVLYVVGVLYAAIMLIISIVRFAINKLKRRKSKATVIEKLRTVLFIAMIAMGISVYLMVLGEGQSSPLKITIACLIVAIATLIQILYSILLFIKRKQLIGSKTHKVSLVCTSIFGFIMTANVLYWQWFNFWYY